MTEHTLQATPLVLSLFPGIGLLDMAFEEEGFCVVRGPDLLWGGDVRRFHPPAGRFDGVIGGPPCQAWSRLRHIVEANGYKTAPDLIPEFERCVAEAGPSWFVMENVPAAPPANVAGYARAAVLVQDAWVGGITSRLRRFTFGGMPILRAPSFIVPVALHREPEHSALASGGGRPVPVAIGGSGKLKRSAKSALKNYGYKTAGAFRESVRKQGLPADFDLPAFTVRGKVEAVGNGVPLPMGRAIARAVRQALGLPLVEQSLSRGRPLSHAAPRPWAERLRFLVDARYTRACGHEWGITYKSALRWLKRARRHGEVEQEWDEGGTMLWRRR